jgi:hypothetical protein
MPSFTRVMTEHDDLTQRLGALGGAPVPDPVRDQHLHAMRAAAPAPTAERRRFGRFAVAAAAIVGFAAGSTGFAMAGALPDPAQGVAHDVLSVVQVDVPDRPSGHGLCMSTAAKQTDPAAKKAEQQACKEAKQAGTGERGRSADAPGKTGDAPGRPAEAGPHPNADTSDCKGRPAWAGTKGGPSAEQRAARDACPPDEGELDEQQSDEADPQRQEAPATPADPAAPDTSPQPPVDPPAAPPADPATPAEPVDPPADTPPADGGQPEDVPPVDG